MASKTLNELTLEQKIAVLKYVEERNSERAIAEKFKISKGSVNIIKHRREGYQVHYEDRE